MKLGLVLAALVAVSSIGVVATPLAAACHPDDAGGTGANAAGHGVYTFPSAGSGTVSIAIWVETNNIPGLQVSASQACGAPADEFGGYLCVSKFLGSSCNTVQPGGGALDPCRASGVPQACDIASGGCGVVIPGCNACLPAPQLCSATDSTGAVWCSSVDGAPMPYVGAFGYGTWTARSAACGAVITALMTACGRPSVSPCDVRVGS